MFFQFIQPYHPQRATTVPAGDDWEHEIKFDGFRVQIHKLGDDVELYSRSGSRFGRRFPHLCEVLRELPDKSAIIDGEISPAMPRACRTSGRCSCAPRSLPNFTSGPLTSSREAFGGENRRATEPAHEGLQPRNGSPSKH